MGYTGSASVVEEGEFTEEDLQDVLNLLQMDQKRVEYEEDSNDDPQEVDTSDRVENKVNSTGTEESELNSTGTLESVAGAEDQNGNAVLEEDETDNFGVTGTVVERSFEDEEAGSSGVSIESFCTDSSTPKRSEDIQ